MFSRAFVLLALIALKISSASAGVEGKLDVSIHGVNYSNQTFSFILIDPNDVANKGGGETIDRFSAGGIVCCYALPKVWRPGIMIDIQARYWVKIAGGGISEMPEKQTVEVPRYTDGKPGELWVIRETDGRYSVVSSNYQPDHEKWPGRVKGWPVPSKEYRLERVELELSLAESSLAREEKIQRELAKNPDSGAREMWTLWKRGRQYDLTKYSGPDDPKFHALLKQDNDEAVRFYRQRVQALKEYKP